jgi:hypothetical protein
MNNNLNNIKLIPIVIYSNASLNKSIIYKKKDKNRVFIV